MTDKKKRLSSRCTENLSPAELRAQIEEDKKKVSRSTVFLFAALIAIIAICIAWFVSNTRVHVTTGTISAQDSTLFELASVGSRTEAESEHLVDANKKNLLTAGNEKKYETYYDMQAESEVKKEQTYHVGTADLAWHLQSANSTVSPGASGKLEFYIIPKVDNLKSVSVTLKLAAYKNSDGAGKDIEIKEGTLQKLVQGHILLFQNLNDGSGYSGWISDAPMIITAPKKSDTTDISTVDNAVFQKGIPYKVTVYWVWPKYFRNYIYNQTTQEDLFGANADSKTRADLLSYVKKQADNFSKGESTIFYKKEETKDIASTDIGPDMSDALLNLCGQYYNEADEYIGTNADYLYVKLEAKGNM